jgi:hypothetical protein
MLFCYRTGYALNARQSAFYSLLLGYSMTFFERLEHADWGLWLLILGQYLLYVLAFGYSLQLTRRMGFRRGVRWAVTGYYLLCPYVIAYLGVAIKDAPYSALMMLLTMLLLDCSLDAEAFCSSKAKLILLARDASDNARDRAEGFARRGAVPLVRLGADKASLASALGVSGGAMAAVCDAGFARALLEKFPEDTERL